MKIARVLLLLFVFLLAAACQPLAEAPVEVVEFLPETAGRELEALDYYEVAFADLAPFDISLEQCWNGMGMDDQGRVYIGFTSLRNDGREDFLVFRYDPASGERRYLGSMIDIAEALGNLQPGESIPKGHTRIIYADGWMYLGTQGFHDFKQRIDDLPNYRGSHLFAYDIAMDQWHDLAAPLPGGVLTEHQGIVGMSILREQNLLVGLAHPHSDIVLYNYLRQERVKVIPGIPWELGNPLSREVIVAPSGNIYTYRGTEDPAQRRESHPVWKYDASTGEMAPTDVIMTNGFWIGQAETRDGSTIYVSTVNGQLYAFDTATETFTDLGVMLPPEQIAAGRRIVYQYGITLSPDESTLYFIPSILENPEGSGELYAYDIAGQEFYFVQELPRGIYTSADLRDDSRIYFAHFGSQRNLWSGEVRLMAITIPPKR